MSDGNGPSIGGSAGVSVEAHEAARNSDARVARLGRHVGEVVAEREDRVEVVLRALPAVRPVEDAVSASRERRRSSARSAM